ncbi:MFS transporter [Litorisediminicola beolgyonensis]|uniref:MFS transporter n=1 Tax=Litorisediminicola beolgyonensis TaxID=1173614 RepID=A0ABW3ZE99_9RHOB
MSARPAHLGGYAAFAAVLSAAGLPIYIHAPKFYADSYGVGLAALGSVLFGLRLLDLVQDPAFGWLTERLRAVRGIAVGVAVAVMALGMIGLFAVTPPVAPILWFALTLTAVFSAFSFLTITFYARGVAKAETLGEAGHLKLARWRETGGLLGVCVAAVLPTAFAALALPEFAGFALVFALACVTAWALMRREWAGDVSLGRAGFKVVLSDRITRRLLLVALANAAPVAVTSTLFLFFVDARLDAPGWEGPFLLLFFLAAAAAAPGWGHLAERVGPKRALLMGMVLSIAAFSGALALGSGDVWWFALVCVASGAALGADMTLLPAIFAERMEKIAPSGSEGFSLWSFAQKFTLAFAAVALLPLLEAAGFRTAGENSARALWALSLLYALVPCFLKLAALALLARTELEGS